MLRGWALDESAQAAQRNAGGDADHPWDAQPVDIAKWTSVNVYGKMSAARQLRTAVVTTRGTPSQDLVQLSPEQSHLRSMRSPSSQSPAAAVSRLAPFAAGTASDSGAAPSNAANATPPATFRTCML